MKRLLVIALLCLDGVAYADEPQARFSLERGSQPHAGMPFKLILAAGGFDQSPAPEQPKLTIANATVTPLGASPNVSQSIEIINGRQSVTSSVTWIFSYRIEAANPGKLQIPTTTITQGSKHATAQGATIDLHAVPSTDDMKLELKLPERPVFVGETVEADLVWLFRSQPEDWTFALAMAQLPELTVSAPPVTDRRKVIEVASATKTLDLPFTMDETTDPNGRKWGRATIKMFVAPHQSGKLTIPATQVTAALPTGPRDFFGNAETQLYRASDVARTLEVKPLPETDKPAGFAGAVGTNFSIAVGTSRSVVQLGEPLELTVTVKSSERLDALALPKLDGPGMLPADKFGVPADVPTGELSDDGRTKTFKVSAVITAPTTEIPALALAYFDPVKGTYQTIRSEPIALSVAGSVVVGAGDVVSSAPKKLAPAGSGDAIDLAQVPVELALSAPGAESQKPLGGAVLWLLVGLLYAVPLAILLLRTWQLRTQDQRDEAAEIRAARKKLDAELDRATTAPARETAGPLAAAMRALARVTEREPDRELLARLETESFAPSASSSPLPSELLAKIREANEPRRASKRPATATALVLFGIALAAPRVAAADALADGRAAYQKAMTITDASARKVAFEQAETLLAQPHSDRPELLADWGNAALGAGDMGTAVLAYRRALAIDPSNARAQHNLAWLRGRVPDALRPTTTAGAADALLFFHDWPQSRQLLVGGLAFAIVVLLLVPWRGSRRRGLAMLAILPGIVWIAMTTSAFTEDRHADDAVVTDSVVLRAADSAGAPAALPQALPRGAEVSVIEQRSPWTKVRVASGTAGWVPDGAIQRVR
jgi:tetratricopeptide (TPR) repeat protein